MNVGVTGVLDEGDFHALFNAMDLAVLPYDTVTQSGVVNWCLAYEVPFVATDLERFRSLEREHGFPRTFPLEDPRGGAEAVRSLLDDANPSVEAIRTYRERHGMDRIAARHEAIYDQLLTNSRTGDQSMISGMKYAVTEIRKNYDNRRWWKQRISHRVVAPIHSQWFGRDDAVRVMDEEWDNLIVLDACRYDLFEEAVDLERFDEYSRVESLGGATPEWTKRNFTGRSFGDTVYISGNPQTTKYAGDSFHRLVEVWAEEFNEERRTVMPRSVSDATLRANEEHPDKRLIAHFMQPHRPFIGPHGRDIHFGGQTDTDRGNDENSSPADEGADLRDPWIALEEGLVTPEQLWKAYRSNLEFAMDEVWQLVDELDGRTVVTSDHGNLMGELGWPIPLPLYGHPTGIRLDELVVVPWAVADGRHRSIVDEQTKTRDTDTDQVEERLNALGYK